MKKNRAFTLVEILAVAAILIVMATIFLGRVSGILLDKQMAEENLLMDSFVADITRSFERSDFEDTNIAAISGDIPGAAAPTSFSGALGAPSTTSATDWFTKLARVRGITPAIGSAPSPTVQPALSRIVYNARRQPRYLFSDPTTNTEYHRFILCTILDDGTLTFPSPGTGTASARASAFEALWSFDFNSDYSSLPTYWASALTSAQQAAWLDGDGDGSNLRRMIVRRISLPRHRVTVNNNHTSEIAYVSWTTDGSAAADMTVTAGAGTVVSAPILEGRQITVKFGTSFAAAVTKYQIVLRRDTTFTVE